VGSDGYELHGGRPLSADWRVAIADEAALHLAAITQHGKGYEGLGCGHHDEPCQNLGWEKIEW
jgi:hypothetical protein